MTGSDWPARSTGRWRCSPGGMRAQESAPPVAVRRRPSPNDSDRRGKLWSTPGTPGGQERVVPGEQRRPGPPGRAQGGTGSLAVDRQGTPVAARSSRRVSILLSPAVATPCLVCSTRTAATVRPIPGRHLSIGHGARRGQFVRRPVRPVIAGLQVLPQVQREGRAVPLGALLVGPDLAAGGFGRRTLRRAGLPGLTAYKG
jgi:hypothetical protein